MALTVVPSARVFNGNVGTQAYVSGSTGSKCLCCPYGYHIDLDFVRYCEAVAAGSADDRSSIERRKKRERRRQCQSMEVLLGLVSPALVGIEAELPKIPQVPTATNGVATLPRPSYERQGCVQDSSALDLSDVVGDFEATLRRSRSTKTTGKQDRTENGEANVFFFFFFSSSTQPIPANSPAVFAVKMFRQMQRVLLKRRVQPSSVLGTGFQRKDLSQTDVFITYRRQFVVSRDKY